MLSRYQFRPRPLTTLAKDPPVTLPAAEVRARDVEWRRVIVRGRFEPRYAVLVDNRIHRGVAGYHVVMPLEIGGSRGAATRYVLVNRGWIAANPDRSQLPQIRTPDATIEITGLAVTPSRRFLELSSAPPQGRVWQNLTLDRYLKAFPVALQPVVIQQESLLDDGLVREWDPPNLGMDMHYGYAFQWFALATTLLAFYLVTHVRRRPETTS